MIICPKCQGTGTIIDQSEKGSGMKKRRLLRGLTLREVATEMNKSVGYISDLEHGRRKWNLILEHDYLDAIK